MIGSATKQSGISLIFHHIKDAYEDVTGVTSGIAGTVIGEGVKNVGTVATQVTQVAGATAGSVFHDLFGNAGHLVLIGGSVLLILLLVRR